MKKNLITLAIVGAALMPTLAAAEVSVYGRAQVEVTSVDSDANPALGIEVKDNSMGRVGFKATEDLGDGLTGIAKFEFKADTADNDVGKCSATTTGTDSLGGAITASTSCSAGFSLSGRESLVGVKGGFGQIELGSVKSEYKYNGGVKYDAFTATSMEARGNGGMSKPGGSQGGSSLGHNAFLTQSLAYRGKAGPIKFGITYAPGEDDGRMSAAAKFGAKNYEAFLALIDQGDSGGTTAGSSEYSAFKIGGMYKMGPHKVMLQFENTDASVNGASNTPEPTFVFIGYQAKFGKNTAVVQFGSNDADGGTDVDYLALGVIHKFSKTMRVFGGYRSKSPDTVASSDVNVITVGLRKDWK